MFPLDPWPSLAFGVVFSRMQMSKARLKSQRPTHTSTASYISRTSPSKSSISLGLLTSPLRKSFHPHLIPFPLASLLLIIRAIYYTVNFSMKTTVSTLAQAVGRLMIHTRITNRIGMKKQGMGGCLSGMSWEKLVRMLR